MILLLCSFVLIFANADSASYHPGKLPLSITELNALTKCWKTSELVDQEDYIVKNKEVEFELSNATFCASNKANIPFSLLVYNNASGLGLDFTISELAANVTSDIEFTKISKGKLIDRAGTVQLKFENLGMNLSTLVSMDDRSSVLQITELDPYIFFSLAQVKLFGVKVDEVTPEELEQIVGRAFKEEFSKGVDRVLKRVEQSRIMMNTFLLKQKFDQDLESALRHI